MEVVNLADILVYMWNCCSCWVIYSCDEKE